MSLNNSQLDTILNEIVNPNTFNLMSNILLLQDKSLFKKLLEYLYDKKISIFDLNNLTVIDDDHVRDFLNTYDTQFNPSPIINNTIPSFNVTDYLYGTTANLPYIYNQLQDYITYKNLNLTSNNTDYNINIIYGDNNPLHYDTENDFINEFNSLVLNEVLTEFNISNINELFPLTNDYIVISTSNTNIKNKYDSLFLSYLSSLNNDNFYKFIVSRNNNPSYVFTNDIKNRELMNFDVRNFPIDRFIQFYLTLLASQNTVFTNTQKTNFINEYNNILFDEKISNSFGSCIFYYNLVKLINGYTSGVDDTDYKIDLDNLITKIDLFKQLVSFTHSVAIQNLTKMVN